MQESVIIYTWLFLAEYQFGQFKSATEKFQVLFTNGIRQIVLERCRLKRVITRQDCLVEKNVCQLLYIGTSSEQCELHDPTILSYITQFLHVDYKSYTECYHQYVQYGDLALSPLMWPRHIVTWCHLSPDVTYDVILTPSQSTLHSTSFIMLV